MSKEFEIKDLKEKVVGHYRSDFLVEKETDEHYKVVVMTYDIAKKPEKLVDVGITFMESGKFFAVISRFEAPDPKLGFVEVAIYDEGYVESGKELLKKLQQNKKP
jgi:hypothetical protein